MRALTAALVTVGLVFALQWERVHDSYPAAFGWVVAVVGIAAGLLAVVLGLARRHDARQRWLVSYGTLTATTCAAVAVAALSHTIIGEGQVSAMLVAPGLLCCALAASAVDVALARASDVVRRACSFGTLIICVAFLSWRLPVVQFSDPARSDALYAVHGSAYAFLAGVAAYVFASRMRQRPSKGVVLALMALAGYPLQGWFGVVIVTVGISVAVALRAPLTTS